MGPTTGKQTQDLQCTCAGWQALSLITGNCATAENSTHVNNIFT
jgi:hypothetical protein